MVKIAFKHRFIGTLFAVALAWVPSASHAQAPTAKPPFQANIDYVQLKQPIPAVVVEPASKLHPEVAMRISVYEFFSYGCIWCYKLEPTVNTWLQKQPNTVEFVRSPVTYRRGWDLLAKLFYIGEGFEKNDKAAFHQTVFQAIHDKNLNLSTTDAAAKIIADFQLQQMLKNPKFKNIADDKMMEKYRTEALQNFTRVLMVNPVIDGALKEADTRSNNYKIHAVPTFIIGGMYETNIQMANGDANRLMAIIDYLIDTLSNTIKTNAKRQQQMSYQMPAEGALGGKQYAATHAHTQLQ